MRLVRLQWTGKESVAAVVVVVLTLVLWLIVVGVLVVVVVVTAVVAEVMVVVGNVVVTVVVVRPAAVVLVVVVGSGRPAAIRPWYPYPLAQTKYELLFMLSGMRPQVSILKKCNQTHCNPL